MLPKLLLVDDEPLTVQLLHFYFHNKGYEVISAHTGEDALVLASIEHPDVIILDLMLPGISGGQVCQQLRASPTTAHIPILIYSAIDAIPRFVLAAGANAFFRKPAVLADIAEAVAKLLEPPTPSV